MADSDEEYDRRRGRDKFRRERSDYDRRDREDRSRRDDWGERRRESRDTSRHDWSRRDYSDYDRRRDTSRYSPQRRDMSPSVKRMRRDWDDSGYTGYDTSMSYAGGHQYGPPPGWGHPGDMSHPHMQQTPIQHGQGQRHGDVDHGMGNQPQMMTFKQFLASQDDSIDDQEAVRKYNEYKIEFKRQQLSDFFVAHKEEEWFRSKYHPDECGKRKEESLKALRNRKYVFLDLFNKGWLDTFSVDVDKQDDIVKYLDAAVIKMEGGSNHDLKILEQPQSPVKTSNTTSPFRRNRSDSESHPDKTADDKSATQKRNSKETEESERRGSKKIETEENEDGKNKPEQKKEEDKNEQDMTPEQQKLAKMAEEYKKQQEDEDDKTEKKEEKPARKKHEYNYDENDSGSGSDTEDSEPEPAPPGVEPPPPGTETNGEEKPKETVKEEGEEGEEKTEEKEPKEEENASKEEKSEEKEKNNTEEKEKDTKEMETNEPEMKEPAEPLPRPLHKTYSLFMRNLAPLITKAEIAALCKRYPGFLRVALADPQPERRFYRRGWITFDRSVNIKEICWNLNNIRLRDCELAPVVNRDLTRRVRPVNGITAHRTIVRGDIKTAAKLVQMLDDKHELWKQVEEEKADPQKESFLMFKNPVLENITDYLVDEISAEEDELLGTSSDAKDEPKEGANDVSLERDDKLIKALDRLVMYLRIVHSVDYYNSVDYPNEDEMPNRCGIMHARGPPPSGSKITQNELTEWQNSFNQKINPLLLTPQAVSEDDLGKFGKKDADVEQQKFITANTQEVAKDKWLCPLSGKKFRGPEFVRKHILNKHGDKLEDVKKEVAFFNNYLADPKRPQLPEPATPKTPSQQSGSSGREGYNAGQNVGYQGPPQTGGMLYNQPRQPMTYGTGFSTPGYGNRNTYDQFSRGAQTFPPKPRSRGPRSDPREIVQYRDLDAPEDMDYF